MFLAALVIDVNGDSNIIPPNWFVWPNSTAIPVPNDSPYKMIFLFFTPLEFNQSIVFFASLYRFSSEGSPSFPLKLLQAKIIMLRSNLLNWLSL